MITKRRVFIVWVNQLFFDSLRLVLRHPDIEWAGSSADVGNLATLIDDFQPDTVLVEEVNDDHISRLINILSYSHGKMQVISLNLNDNQITVCIIGQDHLIKVDDLIRLVLKE